MEIERSKQMNYWIYLSKQRKIKKKARNKTKQKIHWDKQKVRIDIKAKMINK